MLKLEPLAIWLAQHGAARNRYLWRAIYLISPVLAGMIVTFAEAVEPENNLIWWLQEGSDDIQDMMAEISGMINRAPAPMGLDVYTVFVTRLGSLSGDPKQLSWGYVDSTLDERMPLSIKTVQGNRWTDWKRGDGKGDLRAILDRSRPEPNMPVTVIQIAAVGAGVRRTLKAFGAI